jgi:iron complex outermembrane receptor protein
MESLNILVGNNLSYRSSTLFQANGNPQTRQGAFALFDAGQGVQSKDQKLTLTFFVNNITNHFYLTNAEEFFSGATGTFTGFGQNGSIIAPGNYVIGQPARDAQRYFGAWVAVKF